MTNRAGTNIGAKNDPISTTNANAYRDIPNITKVRYVMRERYIIPKTPNKIQDSTNPVVMSSVSVQWFGGSIKTLFSLNSATCLSLKE